jgi:exodeoxyribonuclease VII large subunit
MARDEDEDCEDVEFEPRGHSDSAPLSVSQLTWHIKNLLERSVPKVWVEGEISDLSRPSSGHLYFTLKDDQSQVRAVIWRTAAQRMPFKLKDGMAVICCGGIEVYAPRGSYQLIVNKVQPKGIGELQLAFQQLHQKLAAQGLFDPDRKKPLPRFPKRIGFVTSPSGAALHDFLEAAHGLWSDFELTIIPARVQGEQAASEISRGIRLAQKLTPALDLLIVGRGGGSMEDLWCFNDEVVVRALAACKIPTVSAVGHEIDVTLSDLAADARALTPTHAAQLVFPNRAEVNSLMVQMRRRANGAVWGRVKALKQRLHNYTHRSVLARPHAIHQQRKQMIDELELRTRSVMFRLVKMKREKVAGLARATEALSPLNVLQRGYSVTTTAAGRPLLSSQEIEVGDTVETILSEGRLVCRVEKKK